MAAGGSGGSGGTARGGNIKVDLGSLQEQATSASDVSLSRVSAYQGAIASFSHFAGAADLQGQAYDAAKGFSQTVMTPYYQACILYSEEMGDGCNKLVSLYTSIVGSESLDMSVLRAQQSAYQASIQNLTDSITTTTNSDLSDEAKSSQVAELNANLTAQQGELQKIEEKIQKLELFDSSSASVFETAETLRDEATNGSNAIHHSFNGGSFELPPDMSWATATSERWSTRNQKITTAYQTAVDKVRNGQPLNGEDVLAISRYQADHPDVAIDPAVTEAANKYQVEANYNTAVSKVNRGKDLNDNDAKAIEAYQKAYPNIKIDAKVQKAKEAYTINKNYQEVVDKVKNGKALTDKDIEALEAYQKAYPNKTIDTKVATAQNAYINQHKKTLYDTFKEVMGSDEARRLSQMMSLLPKKVTSSVLKSDGFWEVLAYVEQKGIKGEAFVTAVLNGLSRYERMGKFGEKISKGFTWLSRAASPFKSAVKETLNKVSGIKSLTNYVTKGGKLQGALSKSVKVLGKAGTVLTLAELVITGVSSGISEFTKMKHVGKAVAGGTIDAIKSIGPLEGMTIGAAIGGQLGTAIPIPVLGTVSGGVVGGIVGGIVGGVNSLVQLANPTIYDDVKKVTYKAIDTVEKTTNNINKNVNKAIERTADTVSNTIGGIGKAIGLR